MTGLYKAALWLLPPHTRARHGAQMAAVFVDLVRDARSRRGRRGVIALVTAELAALAKFAWCEWRGAPTPPRIDEREFVWTSPERRSLMFGFLTHDVRYAVRMLRRTPGFTLVCLATMALAIGANSAIFSVVHGVLFKALPFEHPGRVVILGHHTNDGDSIDSTTPGNVYDWMARANSFEALAGFSPILRTLTWDGNAERIRGVISVGNIFQSFGRQAAEGRTLAVSDDSPAAAPVVVLSARLARRIFGERSPIGSSIGINTIAHTVVGVMPGDFAFFDYDDEYWIPARYDEAFRNNRDQFSLLGVAKLKPDVTVDQARAQLNSVMDGIRRDHPQFTQNATAAVAPMTDIILDGVARRLFLLMTAVGVVLLIACANLGNLLLARASARRREISVRHALGARPARIVRQLLTESLVLAFFGGAAGLALGALFQKVLITSLQDMPRLAGVGMNGSVLAFTLAVTVLSGLAFGMLPALQLASRHSDAIREGARGSRRSRRIRGILVVSELALASMLLVGAGLLARSFALLNSVPPGFKPDHLLTFSLSIPGAKYKDPMQQKLFYETAAERLEALAGVEGVTMATTLPVAGRGNGAWFNMLDRPWPASETPPGVPNRVVRANYFQALGIPLVKGRYFTPDDKLDGHRAVIISESLARRFWPNDEALGRRIYMGTSDNRVVPDSEIVGIVADVKQTGLQEQRPEAVYAPHGLIPAISNFTFAVRTTKDPTTLASAARATIRELDPEVPLTRLQTMDEIISRATAPARSSVVLVGVFSTVALALAVIGVFGVLSYSVSQQTRELGIRLALGGTATRVMFLVLREGLTPVVAGVVIGLAGALALTRYISALLFGVTPTDPGTFAAVALLLPCVAALATYIPARRATRIDPTKALRQE